MRVVSLLAGATELVCELGAGDWLVGRSHECDHPAWVKRLPQLSRPTFPVDGTSAEIDRLVRSRLAAQAPLYDVDEAQLTALAPDLIITQTHCEVCAVSPAELAHGGRQTLIRTPVVSLQAGTLSGILGDFQRLGDLLDRGAQARALVERINAEQRAVSERVSGTDRVRVACLEWIEPLFFMGNWGPELVERAGGTNVLGTAGEHSRAAAWQALLQADPEVIVVAPCGFDLARTRAELPTLTEDPRWGGLTAVRSGRVFVADGNLYFNRSGPTLFRSVQALAEMLHPEVMPPDLEGSVWQRL